MIGRMKLYIKILLGREMYIKKQVHCSVKVFGSTGGCFPVRTDTIDANAPLIVYSFGVGEDLSFSQQILQTYSNAHVYAFDPTPKAVAYVAGHPISRNPRFHFAQCGIADQNGDAVFHLPKNENYVSGSILSHDGVQEQGISVQMKTLSTIMSELGHTHIDILKMDIEGSEYSVIPNILVEQCSFSQLCMEHHHRFLPDGKEKTYNLLRLLNKNGYFVASVLDSGEELLLVKQ